MVPLFWLGFALAATPGPDFFLIVDHTLAYGRAIGYATLFGNRLSLCIHITVAVLGLAVAIQKAPQLFLAIRVAGAVYLIYLGVRRLYDLQAPRGPEQVRLAPAGLSACAAFRRGFFNNLLNPKVSLFFLSLFPQFAGHDMLAGSPWRVGVVFFLGNTTWWVPLVFVIGNATVRARLQRVQYVLNVLFGFLFIAFGGNILWDLIRAKN
jgi:threonine/homoserine/homoserine lactone efflux protein